MNAYRGGPWTLRRCGDTQEMHAPNSLQRMCLCILRHTPTHETIARGSVAFQQPGRKGSVLFPLLVRVCPLMFEWIFLELTHFPSVLTLYLANLGHTFVVVDKMFGACFGPSTRAVRSTRLAVSPFLSGLAKECRARFEVDKNRSVRRV